MSQLDEWLYKQMVEKHTKWNKSIDSNKSQIQYISKHYGEKAISVIPKEYKHLQLIGRGVFGEVYLVETATEYLAIKFQRSNLSNYVSIVYESALLRHFNKKKIGPNLKSAKEWTSIERSNGGSEALCNVFNSTDKCICSAYTMEYVPLIMSSLLMSDIPKTILELLVDKVVLLLDDMCTVGLLHNDLHWSNIGFVKRGNNFHMVCIDFGHASIVKELQCKYSIDLYWLVRSLMNGNKSKNHLYLLASLEPLLIRQFKKDFHSKTVLWPTISEFMRLKSTIIRERPGNDKKQLLVDKMGYPLREMNHHIAILYNQMKSLKLDGVVFLNFPDGLPVFNLRDTHPNPDSIEWNHINYKLSFQLDQFSIKTSPHNNYSIVFVKEYRDMLAYIKSVQSGKITLKSHCMLFTYLLSQPGTLINHNMEVPLLHFKYK
jgi:serine/threonine protein kinase